MSSIANNKLNEEKLGKLGEWKQRYTEALIDSLAPSGNVLEIGFSDSVAAERIQKFHPKTHTIIEADPERHAAAIKWAGSKPNVTIIHSTWERALPKLGSFDAVFFNDYPVGSDMEILNFLFPEDIIEMSKQVKQLFQELEEQMSKSNSKFSDQDIKEFYQNIGQYNMKDVPQFFQKLKQNGNISSTQYDTIMKSYHSKISSSENAPGIPAAIPDRMVLFLEACFKGHMNNSGRFSAFLNSQTSNYENPQFFERIITNADLDYTETVIPVRIAGKDREALFILAIRR